jgi:hypothetical protein
MPVPIFPLLEAGYGIYQDIAAQPHINALNNEKLPLESATPATQQLIDMGQYGYTPQETAAFFGNLAKNSNAAYQSTINRTGNSFSGAALAAINSQKLGAMATFTSNDAQLQRSNLKTASNLEQGIANANVRTQQQDLLRRQQAWGGAAKQGIQNAFTGGAQISNDILSNKYLDMLYSGKNPTDPNAGGTGYGRPTAGGAGNGLGYVTAANQLLAKFANNPTGSAISTDQFGNPVKPSSRGTRGSSNDYNFSPGISLGDTTDFSNYTPIFSQ